MSQQNNHTFVNFCFKLKEFQLVSNDTSQTIHNMEYLFFCWPTLEQAPLGEKRNDKKEKCATEATIDDEKPTLTGESTLQACMMYKRGLQVTQPSMHHPSDLQSIFINSKILEEM